jgi:tetratricopeptide (TPR) repeat protein
VVAGGVVAVAMGGIGFLPLFGGPGYEHAIATGLVCPSAAAIATALDVSRNGGTPEPPATPLESVGRGVLAGLGAAAIALATALVHAARVGMCELWGALLYFALTAGAGCVMGGAWGAVVGELLGPLVRKNKLRKRRLAAVLLALAAPVGCIAVSLDRFWSSPMIFAFDPFVGYFSGTLYDTLIEPGTALLTYRLGSLATLVALALVASLTRREPGGHLNIELRGGRALLLVLAAGASIGVALAGTKLGHWSTTASIVKELGAEKHGARCDVVYPNTTRELEANLLVKDCDEELAAVEKSLGVAGPPRVRAFFFRDENEKKRLMGAAHVYIAKPWREEVYLQLQGYPHPVLEHELGHVVAGRFGRGPFRIGGRWGGFLPNPGLIEGVAVFASPEDEDLTDLQWARAMKQIGILPSMRRVFSLDFLGDASSKSYTLAGAFITWIAEKYGVETVRAWYGGGDIEALTHASWDELDRAFDDHLESIPLPAEAESFARARFARPGIFGRKCPHVVDALRHEGDVCRDSQRYADAIRHYRDAIEKDPIDFASQHALAQVERRHGDVEKGRAELERLAASESVPRNWRDRASETLADADFVDGRFEGAAARYESLARRSLDEDAARTLEVKELAARDPQARASVQALLLGDQLHGPDIYVAGVALGTWNAEHASPLAQYLIGRNLVQRAFYAEGTKVLEAASAGGPPTKRIAREALRQRAIAACALGDKAALEAIRAAIESPSDPFADAGGRRDSTLRMIARCRGR